MRPFKGIYKEIKRIFPDVHIEFRVLKLRFLAFSRGYGGFRELREADRKHFRLSWYLQVPGVTRFGPKPRGGLFLPCTVDDKSNI